MKRWGALLLVAVGGGCSTGITAPADMSAAADLSAAAGDMASGCTMTFGGDASLTASCNTFLCHPTGGDNYDDLSLVGLNPSDPGNANAHFDVDGMFALRSYTSGELRSFNASVVINGIRYEAGNGQGSATLTVTGMTRPSASPCDGGAHGTAQASLVEIDTNDGGTTDVGPGRLTLAATF
jgi:hypothetical protein